MQKAFAWSVLGVILMGLPAIVIAIPKDVDIWQIKVFALVCFLLGVGAIWRQGVLTARDSRRERVMALADRLRDFVINQSDGVPSNIPLIAPISKDEALRYAIINDSTKKRIEKERYDEYEIKTINRYQQIFLPKIEAIRNELGKSGLRDEQLDALYKNLEPYIYINMRVIAERLQELATKI